MNAHSGNIGHGVGKPLPANPVVLMRARPGSSGAQEAARAVASLVDRNAAQILVFFHGPGVMAATADNAATWARIAGSGPVNLCICEASWLRRCGQPPPEPFRISSLVQFWHRALDAECILNFGIHS
jgi:sulfur relay (sulfurtransferase) complex TusBCD TusD component (DsrE family)